VLALALHGDTTTELGDHQEVDYGSERMIHGRPAKDCCSPILFDFFDYKRGLYSSSLKNSRDTGDVILGYRETCVKRPASKQSPEQPQSTGPAPNAPLREEAEL